MHVFVQQYIQWNILQKKKKKKWQNILYLFQGSLRIMLLPNMFVRSSQQFVNSYTPTYTIDKLKHNCLHKDVS